MDTNFKTSSSGLPVYRAQFLNKETGEAVSDAEILTHADCVSYTNKTKLVKDKLGFVKGETVDTNLEDIVDRVLYPYYAPEFVSIENVSALEEFDRYITEDTTVVKEKGTTVNNFKLAVKIMAGSNAIVRCTLIRIQNNTREVIENKIITINPGQYNILDFNIIGFYTDTEYFFEVSDNENVVESVRIKYEFALPIFVGYAKDGLLDPTLGNDELNTYLNNLIGLSDRVQKRLVNLNTEQLAFFDPVIDKDLLCPFILVPLKWNSLAKITDINGVDITKFFGINNNIILHTSSENTYSEGYCLYIAKMPVDSKAKTRYLRGIMYTFAYDENWRNVSAEGSQSEIITGFDVLTHGPIDNRFVKESYDDLAYISKPYEGLIVYIKNIKTYYKYNGSAWEVTNNTTRFYSGRPSDTMGGKMDISIDLTTGYVYQKNNANTWELKGNLRG